MKIGIVGLPNAGSKAVYTVLFAMLCIVDRMPWCERTAPFDTPVDPLVRNRLLMSSCLLE